LVAARRSSDNFLAGLISLSGWAAQRTGAGQPPPGSASGGDGMVGRNSIRASAAVAACALILGTTTGAAASQSLPAQHGQAQRGPAAACVLGDRGSIRHVIYIQFDNTHYTRDNPNVPSDLQQMPNLDRKSTRLNSSHLVISY